MFMTSNVGRFSGVAVQRLELVAGEPGREVEDKRIHPFGDEGGEGRDEGRARLRRGDSEWMGRSTRTLPR